MKAYRHYREQCGCTVPDLKEWWYFDPAHSDIPGQAELMFAGKLDLAWLVFRDTWVAPLTLGLAFALVLAGLCLLRARATRARPHADPSGPFVLSLAKDGSAQR